MLFGRNRLTINSKVQKTTIMYRSMIHGSNLSPQMILYFIDQTLTGGSPMHIVIFITAGGREEAVRIAKALVEERLAACVNIIEDACSIFRWEGKVTEAKELLLIVKSVDNLLDSLIERVKELHSYTTPEIISFKIVGGSKEYLDWMVSNVKTASAKKEW